MPTKRSRKSTTRRARGTGSIFYHEGKESWVGRVVVGRLPSGKPKYREFWGKTQGEVVKKMAAAEAPGPGTTVAGWVGRWWDTHTVRPSTRINYRERLDNHILPGLGHLRLTDVTPNDVEGFAARLLKQKELSPSMVVGVLAVARVLFEAALRSGFISRNPVALARKPRRPKKKVETFPPADMLRIIGAHAWYSGGGAIATMAATGCRIGEAIALDVPDFDATAGTISITKTVLPARGIGPPKSANGVRTIRVPAVLMPILAAAAGRRKAGPLFLTAKDRRQVAQIVGRSFKYTLRDLKLPHRNGHVLRHSVASHLIAAHVPVADVAKYLGDSVATIVNTYLHPSGADPADALDRLYGGRKVGGGGTAKQA